MADVYAVFGTLLALGIVFPGMLTAWWLIFPGTVDRASGRLEHSPWKSLALGAALAVPVVISMLVLSASPFGRTKFLSALLLLGTLAFASLGASGLAALMARRLRERTAGRNSAAGSFVRGALALELAAAFPVIGWLLVIPVATLTCLGATAFAVLGWMPGGWQPDQAAASDDQPAGVEPPAEAIPSQA